MKQTVVYSLRIANTRELPNAAYALIVTTSVGTTLVPGATL